MDNYNVLRYKLVAILLLFFPVIVATGSESAYKFRIYLKDKGETQFSTENPHDYLSQKAIDRRLRQNILIDKTDLPISPQYISRIEALGCEVVAKSKWLASVTVHCEDSLLVEEIKGLDFVKGAVLVWKKQSLQKSAKRSTYSRVAKESFEEYYQAAYEQIAIHNGDSLHRAGFRGAGMEIAVIDAGFKDLDENALLENITVKGRKNFIYSKDDAYEVDHGLRVLSCMATNLPGIYIGTAPDAQYWLFQTENPVSEYPVEEDYWVTAAEYADSVGVDMINSSLGYSSFDDSKMNYTYSQIDGNTIFVTKGAAMASDKGILIVSSAGNEGSNTWRHITAPADAKDVLTVGAIKKDSLLIPFSSRGPTVDFRIKPDVVAVGSSASTVTVSGNIGDTSGTSFSSPIMCGLVACLWQAYPNLTNKELIEIVRKSSNKYLEPDNNYGYGIPDMIKAMDLAKETEQTAVSQFSQLNENIRILFDSTGYIRIMNDLDDNLYYTVHIYSVDGKRIITDTFRGKEKVYQLEKRKNALYIVNVRSKSFSVTGKGFF